MARNGTGGYQLPANSFNPAVNGVAATAADWNSTAQDIQAAIQQSVSSDGQTPMTGNLNMNGNKITGLANASASGDAVSLGRLDENDGSSLIGFLQAGTGAVSTTVQAKLRNFVSVKDFGAVGDGVADDTAAIQLAIDYCTNLSNRKQTLYFPANNAAASYKVTAPLVITSRLNIVGDGQFSTVIFGSGLTAGQFIVDFDCLSADVVYHSSIENITIQSDGTTNGVRLKNISYMLMKQVQLKALIDGVVATGTTTFSNFFEQVTGSQINSSTFEFSSFTGGGQYYFSGCTFTGTDGFVVDSASGTDALTFYNCNWEQCTVTDLYVAGTVNGLTISGCRSEGLNGGDSFLISPTGANKVTGLVVTGCIWQTDFGNSNPVNLGGNVKGFSITGNTAFNAGFIQFVNLNGTGEAGVISGNYCENSPKVVSAPRDNVIVQSNRNSSGPLPEYDGVYIHKAGGTFTGTLTGVTTTVTGVFKYAVSNSQVTIDIPAMAGVSNTNAATVTGMPTEIRPAVDKDVIVRVLDNSVTVLGFARVKTTGVIELYSSVSGNVFVASGNKGTNANSIAYTLA